MAEKNLIKLNDRQTLALFAAGAAAIAGVLGAPLAVPGGLVAVAAAAWWKSNREPQQNFEDLCSGSYYVGVPRSGKTFLAFMHMQQWVRRGFGGCWGSVKGASDFIRYFPKEAAERIVLLQPHGPYPRGLNLLQTYAKGLDARMEERHMIALLVSDWFSSDVNSKAGHKMKRLLYMGVQALLAWADKKEQQVSLSDLQRFFDSEDYRTAVLAVSPSQVRSTFDKTDDDGLDRVAFALNSLMMSPTVCATFGQREGVNLVEIMNSGKWLVLDAPKEKCPDSWFLCQTLASLVERLTPHKKKITRGGRPWMALFDEIQHYPSKAFANGIALGPEYGVGWCLIHQSEKGQLADHRELSGAVNMCGNRFFFRQTPQDASECVKYAVSDRWKSDDFITLPKRHYKGVLRVGGYPYFIDDAETADIGKPDLETVKITLRTNYQGKPRKEVMAQSYAGSENGW